MSVRASRRGFLAAGAGLSLSGLSAGAAAPPATRIEGDIPDKGYARVSVQGGRIAAVSILGPEKPDAICCAPGLVDIQLNGYAGINFSDPELKAEQLISLMPALWKTGVTSFYPT